MAILKQSTTYTRMFLMVDSADHVTGKTGLTVTVTLSKAGGTFAAAGATITEVSSGWYKAALTTTDTNTLGDLAYHCTATGADPTDFVDQVSARLIDDAAYPATSGRSMVVDANGLVDANTVKIGPSGTGTAQTAGDVGAKTGFALTAAYDAAKTAAQAGNAMTLTAAYDFAKGTAAMTESYALNGVAPTPIQAIYAMHQTLMDFSISGTLNTVKKLDNATTAFTITLNDATAPTAASRA
ncbi:MAG: hypothetical protein ACM3IH_14060 [Sphingobacteriales bacterium]